MQHDATKLLFDVRSSCINIQEFISGQSLQDIQVDLKLRSAIERQFEIIGEALNRIGALDDLILDNISDARNIIGLRNRIAHGYDSINYDVLWNIATDKVPLLLSDVDKLLA